MQTLAQEAAQRQTRFRAAMATPRRSFAARETESRAAQPPRDIDSIPRPRARAKQRAAPGNSAADGDITHQPIRPGEIASRQRYRGLFGQLQKPAVESVDPALVRPSWNR